MKHRVKQISFAVLGAVWSLGIMAQTDVTRAEYWLDHDFDSRTAVAVSAGNWTQQLDVSTLPPGLHNVGIRFGTADGRWSSVLMKNFLIPQPSSLEENTLQRYEYWIDHQFDARTSGTIAAGGVIELQPDFSALAPGLHNIAFRVLDTNGHSSSILVMNFLVPNAASGLENGLTKYRYWIDRDQTAVTEGTVAAGGLIDLQLDLKDLSAGLHCISYQVMDLRGNYSAAMTNYFLRTSLPSVATDKIVAYDYWFNNGPRTRVALDPQQAINVSEAIVAIPETALPAVPADYQFDVESKTVSCTSDITVGVQVFNNEGTGSSAVVETLTGIPFSVHPEIVALPNDDPIDGDTPVGGTIVGLEYDAVIGDYVHWTVEGGNVKVDIYDLSGNRVDYEEQTIEGKRTLCFEMTGTKVYALMYGATNGVEQTIVTAHVAIPSGIQLPTATDIRWPADIYTPDGRLFRKNATSQRGLPAGIYVIDGQKLVIR